MTSSAKARKPYTPGYKRTPTAMPAQAKLTKRDRQIILGVYRYRLLSAEHIEILFFPPGPKATKPRSTKSSCQYRLKLLYHWGFLDRVFQPVMPWQGQSVFVYVLDEQGADLVAATLGIDRAEVGWKPQHNEMAPSTLAHSLAISDVRVVINKMSKISELKLMKWIGEVEFQTAPMKERVPYQTRGARVERKYPDGYFVLQYPNKPNPAHFYLEVDRGTMTNTRWQGKIEAYEHFRKSGLAQKHYGTQNFRVLSVTTSQRRLKNLKQATEKAGGDHRYWFTTQEQIDIWHPDNILEPIWSIATREGSYSLI